MEAAAKVRENFVEKKVEVKLVSVPKSIETLTEQEELERQLRLYAEAELCYNNCNYKPQI